MRRRTRCFWCGRGRCGWSSGDRVVEMKAGDFCVAPRGVEHRPVALEEVEVVLFEPAGVRNTGNVVDEKFTAPGGVRG